MDFFVCAWCQFQNELERVSCSACGAPLHVAKMVSDAGWRAAPRLRDMTEFRVGNSICQIAGEVVPAAEFALADGEGLFFEQRTLLWKEREVSLAGMTLKGASRTVGGMPYAVVGAHGPGRIAFTRDASGEVVVLPLHPGMELDVRGHAFLVATQNVTYDFIKIAGLVNMLHGGPMYIDRFVTQQTPGLLLLHGYGNVFERSLAAGETIQVEPGGFLYKDSSVAMNTIKVRIGAGLGHTNANLAEMTGPGRLGIQSMYRHHHAG
jgi:uncharacterized protein (AIM24 family)